MDKHKAEIVARELMNSEFMKGEWYEGTLASWLRQGCKCAYCDCNLLSSRDAAYFGWCNEHILPKSQYPALADSEWNTVLACRPCNQLKARWDPNGEESGERVYTTGALTQEQAATLIGRVRTRIQDRRKVIELRFQQQRSAIENALRTA